MGWYSWTIWINNFCIFTLIYYLVFLFISHLAISESKNDQLEKEVEILKQELLQARQAGDNTHYAVINWNVITFPNSSPYKEPN